MNKEDVKNRVENALAKFLKNESYLLKEDVNERSITHILAEYLKPEFPGYDIDCEYNKRTKDGNTIPKKLMERIETTRSDDTDGKKVYPDIIIHKRPDAEHNLLVIEVKKETNRSDPNGYIDALKLNGYIDEIGYQSGLFIKFKVKNNYKDKPICKWFPESAK